jgi:sigma-B regulation protein RsbU (phosphoserine phosphatase)
MSRVLVVDGDPDALQLTRLWLVSAGHEVLPAATAEEALRLAAGSPPQVAVVAAGEGGSGAALLEQLAASGCPACGVLVAPPGAAATGDWGGPLLSTPLVGSALLSQVDSLSPGCPVPLGPVAAPAERAQPPAQRAEQPASTAAPGTQGQPVVPPAGGQPYTVLVVDDEADLRELLVRQLTMLGYRPVPAADGVEALQLMRRHTVDALLLDIDMPRLDGHGVLRAMRADPVTASVPVVLLTARTQGSDVAVALGLGADDYVRKPFSLTEVSARLVTAIGRARTLDRLVDLRDVIVPTAPEPRSFLRPAVAYQPCQGAVAGGDLHCLVEGPRGTTYAVVADVSGHGPAVAATAAHLRAVVTNHAANALTPASLLRRINTSVLATGDAPDGTPVLVTAVVLQFHPDRGAVTCASAGHPAPLLLPSGQDLPGLDPGPPLGVMANPSFPLVQVPVSAGTGLLLHTDGLTEGRRQGTRELFGDRALAEAVRDAVEDGTGPLDPDAVVDAVLAAHTRWVRRPGEDDVTVVAFALTDDWAVAGSRAGAAAR